MVTRSYFWYAFTSQGVSIMSIDADSAFFRNPFKQGFLDQARFSLELSAASRNNAKVMREYRGFECNVLKGYPNPLRNVNGERMLCAALPPPYFATPASAWWFERHTRLALQCQMDIQSDTTIDLADFYPDVRHVKGDTTMFARLAGTSASGAKDIMQPPWGAHEFHGQVNASKFEPLPAHCRGPPWPGNALRMLPMDFIVEKCIHNKPVNASTDNGLVVALHANCAVGLKATVRDRIKYKTRWLKDSGVWFL
mmetsp:Transcript_30897/g.78211  ORF Transcript_30897/g.78211 Transcript_30897/m.78211 type:complete len:253 (-) Transcript_30897:601-1359(-)